MGYLVVEMIVLLLIAAVIGFILGWFLRRPGNAGADMQADYKAKLEAAEARAASLNKEVEQDQVEIEQLRGQLEATRREVNEEREKLGALEGDASALREKDAALAAAKNDIEKRDTEIERLRSHITPAGSGSSTEDVAALQADIDRLNGELNSAKAAHADCQAKAGGLNDRIAELEAQLAKSSESASSPDSAPAEDATDKPRPDWLLDQPDGEVDDLKKIKGVGPVMERTLNKLGIYHFRQVAKLDAAGIAWVSDNIQTFPDRIKRDRWVEQASELHTTKYGSAP